MVVEFNGRTGGRQVRNKYGAVLKGILRCGSCEAGMAHTYTQKASNKLYRYYVCVNAHQRGYDPCQTRSVSAPQIEQAVVEQIRGIAANPSVVDEVVRHLAEQQNTQREALEREKRVMETVGVDVQKDRLEMELVGWGRGEENWSIEYRVLPGDPSGALVWQELDTYLERRWPHETGISLPVAACAIDAGYESQAVYEFCRTRYHRRIFAVKGKSGPLPVWQRKPTSKNIRGEKPWIVGTDTAKETVYGRLKNPTPGTPGYSHFPAERTETYFEQLLGEVLVTTYAKGQPKREWRPKPGVRQEALDARVYASRALLPRDIPNNCRRLVVCPCSAESL